MAPVLLWLIILFFLVFRIMLASKKTAKKPEGQQKTPPAIAKVKANEKRVSKSSPDNPILMDNGAPHSRHTHDLDKVGCDWLETLDQLYSNQLLTREEYIVKRDQWIRK